MGYINEHKPNFYPEFHGNMWQVTIVQPSFLETVTIVRRFVSEPPIWKKCDWSTWIVCSKHIKDKPTHNFA